MNGHSIMKVTSLGFRTDIMLREMAGSTVEDAGTHLVVRTAENPGYWWGNFVLCAGPPRPGDAERWAETFARHFPTPGTSRSDSTAPTGRWAIRTGSPGSASRPSPSSFSPRTG